MITTPDQGSVDVADILTAQHEHLKTLMSNVFSSTGAERHEAFDQVRYTLAAHEAAEAEVMSAPALRDLTLFVRNDEDTLEIASVAPAGALDGEPINTLGGTPLAANPVS
jgi:hypothetical protein